MIFPKIADSRDKLQESNL